MIKKVKRGRKQKQKANGRQEKLLGICGVRLVVMLGRRE